MEILKFLQSSSSLLLSFSFFISGIGSVIVTRPKATVKTKRIGLTLAIIGVVCFILASIGFITKFYF